MKEQERPYGWLEDEKYSWLREEEGRWYSIQYLGEPGVVFDYPYCPMTIYRRLRHLEENPCFRKGKKILEWIIFINSQNVRDFIHPTKSSFDLRQNREIKKSGGYR